MNFTLYFITNLFFKKISLSWFVSFLNVIRFEPNQVKL